jgi:hypothetical protein
MKKALTLILMLIAGNLWAETYNIPADVATIQEAIDLASEGDTILVAPGTYVENIVFSNLDLIVTSTDPEDPAIVEQTIIDGGNAGTVVTFQGQETSNCVVNGFTITGGNNTTNNGGGIYGGYPDSSGQQGTQATIRNCRIINNNTSRSGGGIANCDGLIENCVIANNTSSAAGGGVWHSDGHIRNNMVYGNESGQQGGGLCGCSRGIIEHNIVYNNSTGDWGGGINKCGLSTIRFNTVYNNTADYGGGLCDPTGSEITHNIVWGNTGRIQGDQIYNLDESTNSPTYCCIEAWTVGGTNNITTDPLFADASNVELSACDFHLQSQAGRWDPTQTNWVIDVQSSLCIDAGNPETAVGEEPAPNGRLVNLGAYGETVEASKTVVAANNLLAVTPNQAEPGTTSLTVTFTLPNSTPPTPPEAVIPNSVTLGTISGTLIERLSFDTVTAVFDIPSEESEGVKDVVITFPKTELSSAGGFTVGAAAPVSSVSTNGPPAEGYNLFCALTSTDTVLMDNDENILKTWSSSYTPGNSVYLLEDGTLMRTANTGSTDFSGGGEGGRLEQYNWDGDLIWAFDYDTADYRQHHDFKQLPNGNILMIAWEKKTEAEALAAGRNAELLDDGELWPDHVIEVEPSESYGGTIVWEWHAWDHLTTNSAVEPNKININYTQSGRNDGAADWHHINAIDYNEELDQILLSVRNFSEIWVIDHNTTTAEAAGSAGDVLYRWGNSAAYGGTGDQQLFVQHNAQWIEHDLLGENNILIFNNGEGRTDGDYSSVDEIVPPMAADGSYTSGLPLTAVWTYTNSVSTNFYASHISGAHRLPNGNTLICDGTGGKAFEVTGDGGLVWDYTVGSELFRFERYAPDFAGFADTELALPNTTYAIVDTAQPGFYNDTTDISAPETNDAFYGQDACYDGNQPKYLISPDGLTVYDYNTGLTWTRSHDWSGDGVLDADDKMTQADADAYAATLNSSSYAGYDDWRLPSIKELYSLMDFRGTDPDPTATNTVGLIPFIDSSVFEIGYGDLEAGDRIIDSQFATTTIYIDMVMNTQEAMFGLNLVDGRIKGYPTQTGKGYYAYYCRGNSAYGVNDFSDNGDGTVTDNATKLMWAQADAGGMDWESALAYAESSELAGHSGWRLPNTKELQSIVDYTRSPGITASAAIDPVFSATQITNMAGQVDYPWYWTGTTHLSYTGSAASGSYVCFGRGTGTIDEGATIIDVHGAGCQRSDPKSGDPADYPSSGHGPQGDVQRVYNHVRLVRDADSNGSPVADTGGPYSGFTNAVITLDASASTDPDGTIIFYDWDLNNDGLYETIGMNVNFESAVAGSYTVGLRVIDNDGNIGTDTATVTILNANGLPEVTIASTDRFASEDGLDTGTFTISRSGWTTGNLTVQLSVGGTATEGDDYLALPRTAVISNGQSSVDVTLTSVHDELVEGIELVGLAIVADAAYTIGNTTNAIVRIEDDDALRLHSVYMDGDKLAVKIGWLANEGFTLWRTDNLVSNNWTMVSGQEFEDNGEAVLILRDPSPPESNAFYRVTSP